MTNHTKLSCGDISDLLGIVGCHADQITRSRKGSFIFRKGFFYTHKKTTADFVAKILEAFPHADIINSDEIWKPFRGGASIKNQSHWMVEFVLDGRKVTS